MRSDIHKLFYELLNEGNESEWLEFKTNFGEKNKSISPEGVGEYISALSNSACISGREYGYLVLGVASDNKSIVGTDLDPSSYKWKGQDFELRLRSMISPKIHFEIFPLEVESKRIIIFKIPSAQGEPTSFMNKQFVRINSSKTSLLNHPDLMRKIYNSIEDWSANIIKGADVNCLDEKAIEVARRKYAERNSNQLFADQLESWDNKTFLDKARLTKNGDITNACLLLLGKEECSYLLSPFVAEITWKLDTDQQAYEHYTIPFLLNTTKILSRIRNFNYSFFPETELLATTVQNYEPRVILEALHNAIAHQDYSSRARVIVTEKVDRLVFENAGGFFYGQPDDYFYGKSTPARYRNDFLVRAMFNVGMIDTIGYGIHTMLLEQKRRFFPLPDYSKSSVDKVVLEIFGHEIDVNYSRILIENKGLELETIILLDKIQKKQSVEKKQVSRLRKLNLLAGRAPNFYLSSSVAVNPQQRADFIKNRSFNNTYFKDLIVDYLKEYGKASKQDIEILLIDKLPQNLSEQQKRNKIRNLTSDLSTKEKRITNRGTNRKPEWELTKN